MLHKIARNLVAFRVSDFELTEVTQYRVLAEFWTSVHQEDTVFLVYVYSL